MSKEIAELFDKANKGSATHGECVYLKQKIDDNESPLSLPDYCTRLIEAVTKNGVLQRRSSRAVWTPAEGHGNTKDAYNLPTVVGGAHDTVQPGSSNESIADLYLKSKPVEVQDAVKKAMIRTASRGGVPRLPVPAELVEAQKQEDLKKRMSRKQSQKASATKV